MAIDPTWEPPSLREKEHSLWWLWLLLLLLIVGLVVYFVLNQPAKVVSTQQETTKQPATTETVTATSKEVFKSESPEFDSHCNAVAGFVPGSLQLFENKITFTIKNNGKVNIEGSYFEASGEGKKAYRKNTESLEPGKGISYTLDLSDVSNEVGVAVSSFIIYPIQNSKACLNQRMIVIK